MSSDAEYFNEMMEERLIERGINPNDVCPSEYLDYFFEDEWEYTKTQHYRKNNELPAGKCIHIVTLSTDKPAKPLSVEWLHCLKNPLDLSLYNYLADNTWYAPAKFFIDRGMQVRSRKIDGQWKQIVFCDHHDDDLSGGDMDEYERLFDLEQLDIE